MTAPASSPGAVEAAIRASGAAQHDLHAAARETRDSAFGPRVFVRAVIEISNFCRENCAYCGMRRDNRALSRYRAGLDTLRRIVFDELPGSVTDLNIQTGEDPVAVREIIVPFLREVRAHTGLGISGCLGTLSPALYRELRDAGAGYYIIKIETGNAPHFETLQAPGTLAERVAAIHHLAGAGWLVSSGFIMGLPGQTPAHLAETFNLLSSLPLAGSSVSPFIPGSETPFAGQAPAPLDHTLNALALLRLRNPRHVIPAVSAFNILDESGYTRALRAGANLATINLTPQSWRGNYVLYRRNRVFMNEERVLRAIDAAGLLPSSQGLLASLTHACAA